MHLFSIAPLKIPEDSVTLLPTPNYATVTCLGFKDLVNKFKHGRMFWEANCKTESRAKCTVCNYAIKHSSCASTRSVGKESGIHSAQSGKSCITS
ncbi:hypothetical protein AVEN_145187-1 [Araneus ventricosus]|uniref:Uncharacterized protein n=1 Tax=Araneus ventricosus TaxID=182803 RepID=A0A4Y2P2C8_ARAVE|nr:hypothetical protein AVEN_145187-1 [Araneus ventricosus]